MAALVAGASVMMVTLYFYQMSELDALLAEEAHELVWDLENFRAAPKDPSQPLSEELIPVQLRENYLVVEGPGGQVVYQSSNLRGTLLVGEPGQVQTENVFGNACRVGAWKVGPYLVRIGARVNMIERLMNDIGIGFATSLPVMGLVVFFGGMWLGRRMVAPLAELSSAAQRISASNPQERLPLPPPQDEIAELTEVLNRSFNRLQISYNIATRFSADASHQLKTPVTILRAGLDHLSCGTDLNEAQAAEVSMLRQQTRRLTSLIEDLLLLAQADAGRMLLDRRDFDLVPLVEAAADDLLALVDERRIQLEMDLPKKLLVKADRRLIGMALQNLVENAAKYTANDGCIRLAGFLDADSVGIIVANTGKGIPVADRELIFERFRRGSDTGGKVEGHGLGLNIARELARAHRGDLVLKTTGPDWTVFELRLPRHDSIATSQLKGIDTVTINR
jgi:two-component system heavy metal sensor histidine kinase CusS